MAYTFNGSNQYLSATASPLGTGQLGDHTIAFWVQAAAQNGVWLFSISRSTETTGFNNPAVGVLSTTAGRVNYFLRANSSGNALAWATGVSGASGPVAFNSSWNHVAVRLSGTTASTWINGALGEQSTTGLEVPTTTGLNRLGIAALVRGNVAAYAAATVAEVGVWSAAITDEEIASLARAVSPALVRPQSLAFFAPLIRDVRDIRAGLAITNNNSATVADHPRVYA